MPNPIWTRRRYCNYGQRSVAVDSARVFLSTIKVSALEITVRCENVSKLVALPSETKWRAKTYVQAINGKKTCSGWNSVARPVWLVVEMSRLDVIPFDKKARTNYFVELKKLAGSGLPARRQIGILSVTTIVSYHASVDLALKEHHVSTKTKEMAKPKEEDAGVGEDGRTWTGWSVGDYSQPDEIWKGRGKEICSPHSKGSGNSKWWKDGSGRTCSPGTTPIRWWSSLRHVLRRDVHIQQQVQGPIPTPAPILWLQRRKVLFLIQK